MLCVNEGILSLSLQVICHVGRPVLYHEAFVQPGKMMDLLSTHHIQTARTHTYTHKTTALRPFTIIFNVPVYFAFRNDQPSFMKMKSSACKNDYLPSIHISFLPKNIFLCYYFTVTLTVMKDVNLTCSCVEID